MRVYLTLPVIHSSAQIDTGAIATASLADGAVTTIKIADANVTAAKLANTATSQYTTGLAILAGE